MVRTFRFRRYNKSSSEGVGYLVWTLYNGTPSAEELLELSDVIFKVASSMKLCPWEVIEAMNMSVMARLLPRWKPTRISGRSGGAAVAPPLNPLETLTDDSYGDLATMIRRSWQQALID